MSQPQNARVPTSALILDYPMSLGVYERYEQAQQSETWKQALHEVGTRLVTIRGVISTVAAAHMAPRPKTSRATPTSAPLCLSAARDDADGEE